MKCHLKSFIFSIHQCLASSRCSVDAWEMIKHIPLTVGFSSLQSILKGNDLRMSLTVKPVHVVFVCVRVHTHDLESPKELPSPISPKRSK